MGNKIAVGGLTVSLACLVIATTSSPAKADDQVAADAAKGRALTAEELSAIYGDRTWHWQDGGAYFRPANHVFTAWVGKDKRSTYAEGSWSVSDQGRLCYTATWYSLAGHGGGPSCFEHRKDDKNVYQRKLPDGKWSVFSHLPAAPDDEMQKLEPGDHVSEDYEKNKRYLAEHKDQLANDAANARPLTSKELNSIYEDRTWHWEDGAAYFHPEHRAFTAWVGNGKKASYAEGSWSVSDQGRLCFDATWYGIGGGHTASTSCFDHRRDDGNIYQRKLTNGKWYVFSHLPTLPDDQINKLEQGDHASDNYQRNKHYLNAHTGRPHRKK